MLDSKKKAQYLTRKFVNHLMVDGKKEKAEKLYIELDGIVLNLGQIVNKNLLNKTNSARIISNHKGESKSSQINTKTNYNNSQTPIAKIKSDNKNENNKLKTIELNSKNKSIDNTKSTINTPHLNTISYENDDMKKRLTLKIEKKTSQKTFQSMLDRMKTFEIAKEKRLEYKKNEKETEIKKDITKVPKINEKSKKLLDGNFFTRQEKFKKEKELKLKINKEILEEVLKKTISTKKVNKNVIENNIINQLKWENDRKQKIINKKEKELLEEIKTCTFKPEINVNYKFSNQSLGNKLFESIKINSKDDIKIELNKPRKEKEFIISRSLKKNESCKNYKALFTCETENNIIENMFNEKFKDLANKLY